MHKVPVLFTYPYVYLLLTMLIWSLALIEAVTGSALTRWGMVARDEKPESFRAAVLMHVFGGLFFFGIFLFRFYRL
jgi:hypothetical protein